MLNFGGVYDPLGSLYPAICLKDDKMSFTITGLKYTHFGSLKYNINLGAEIMSVLSEQMVFGKTFYVKDYCIVSFFLLRCDKTLILGEHVRKHIPILKPPVSSSW